MSEDWPQLNRKCSMSHYIDLTATYSAFVIARGLDFVSTRCKHKNIPQQISSTVWSKSMGM